MKKLIYLFFAVLVFAGCNKNIDPDLTFGKLPEERMAERNAELKSKLTGAENGWIASLTTGASGGFGFYMKFLPDEKVLMMGDLSEESTTIVDTSTYRIKYVMNTSLIFDTYNYLSLLQDPSPDVFGGIPAQGYRSDIEFEYIRSTADSIFLRGKRYQNNLYLVKASSAQASDYKSGKLLDKITDLFSYLDDHSNNYININGITNKIATSIGDNKLITFQYANEKDSIITVNGKYNFDLEGINFPDGVVLNGITFSRGVLANNILKLYDLSGKEYLVAQNGVPIIPFKLAFGYNKTYKGILITGQALPAGVTSSFNAVFNGMVARFNATGRTIQTLEIRFTNSTTLAVNLWYLSGTSRFLADASFKYTYEDGILTLTNYTPAVSNANWNTRIAQIGNFVDWLQSGPFKVDWVASSNPSVGSLGGLYRVADPTSIFYGSPNP